MKLGGALILPYFSFLSEDDNELQAKSEAFLMNTQASLKYYYLWNQTGIYDAVYLFGDESQTEVDTHLGGQNQRNAPHFIELYAALAAIHFFGANFEADQPAQYFMTARRQNNRLQWEDLPDGNHGHTIRSKIGQLARFAFAYLSVYQPMLEDIHNKGKGYRAPWFVDFFERNQIKIDDDKTQNHSRLLKTTATPFCVGSLTYNQIVAQRKQLNLSTMEPMPKEAHLSSNQLIALH